MIGVPDEAVKTYLRGPQSRIFVSSDSGSPQIHGPPRESHFCPPKIACNFGGTEWIRGGVP